MIKQVGLEHSESPFSLIDSSFLNKFYQQSLQTDNFNGLGHLLTYVEKYGVDIGEWNLSKFKGALDFHLNQRFNLNNVLIFTKYYTCFHQCRLRNELRQLSQPLSELSESDKFALNARVFNNQSLVDMRSLFGYLVKNLGTRQAIDPVTKEDALWRVLDFFTKSGVADIAQFSQTSYNGLNDKDVAAYLANRINDSKAFERTTQVLLRLKDRDTLHSQIIQNLKEHAAQNQGTLPMSFEPAKARKAYLTLKASKNVQLSEKNLEYFLYVFKSLEMWPEIIDVCENFEKLTGSSDASSNEIKNYYLSDTLLNLPSKEHYFELVKNAVYEN